MSRLSTQAKARICDELVNAGYTTHPLCEFYGSGAHGVRVYWENVGIRDYNLNDEYFLKNKLNAKIAKQHAENCAEDYYLSDIMYHIKSASDLGSTHVNYKLHAVATNNRITEKIIYLLTNKGFRVQLVDDKLVIHWL